jgi:hypothetical protein
VATVRVGEPFRRRPVCRRVPVPSSRCSHAWSRCSRSCASPSSTSAASSTPGSRTGTPATSGGASCTPTRTRSGCRTRASRSLRGPQRAAGVLAERTYSVWPDLEALMREHGVPQFTVDAHRPSGRSTCSGELSRPSSATPTCSPRSTSPASRARADRTDEHPVVVAGGTRRSTPSRSPTSSTRRRRRRRAGRAGDHRPRREWKARGRPRSRGLLLRLARRAVYVPRSTTSTTCPTAGSVASPRTGTASRGGSASTRSWTSTSGRTRRPARARSAETVHER